MKEKTKISVSEASKIAEVNYQTVLNWIKKGKLSGMVIKKFNKLYVYEEDFKKWLEAQTQEL